MGTPGVQVATLAVATLGASAASWNAIRDRISRELERERDRRFEQFETDRSRQTTEAQEQSRWERDRVTDH